MTSDKVLWVFQGLLPAAGLVIMMVGATVVTAAGGSVVGALFPPEVGFVVVSVAYGRRRLLR